MKNDLIIKAKEMVAKIKEGNVYRLNLKAIKIMEALINALEKAQNKDGNETKDE